MPLRLIGIDTPEVGEICATEATEAMKALVEDRNVRIDVDVSDVDRYDRLLRYVFSTEDGTFINEEMVRMGWAERSSTRPTPGTQRCSRLPRPRRRLRVEGCGVAGARCRRRRRRHCRPAVTRPTRLFAFHHRRRTWTAPRCHTTTSPCCHPIRTGSMGTTMEWGARRSFSFRPLHHSVR